MIAVLCVTHAVALFVGIAVGARDSSFVRRELSTAYAKLDLLEQVVHKMESSAVSDAKAIFARIKSIL